MVVLQTVLFGVAMVLTLYFFGYGITRLLLPRALKEFEWLLMPFFGMALVIVWDYIALWLGFNLAAATWALVGVALVVMVGARVKGEISRSARNDKSQVASDKSQVASGKSQAASDKSQVASGELQVASDKLQVAKGNLWVVALAVLAFCAAVAPLWRYGFVTVIGENWDYEFYLPLADYLREYTTAQLANAPPNPLLSTILSRHILPLPMGFSYLHATLNELLRTRALDTFPILMGVLRALGVVGAFLFFRAAFKMSERAALIAAALVAVNGLLLWFTYWSFGLHLAALALLPVGLALGALALETKKDWRAWVSAGLLLGALNVTYHPALIVAGLSLGAFGVWLLITERGRTRVLLNGAAVAALTLAFSFPALGHIDDFVREYYGRTPLAVGLREFVPFADGYGFSDQTLELVVGQTISTPQLFAIAQAIWNGSGTILTLAAAGFSILALWELRNDKGRRGVWYAMVAAALVYLLVSRLPFLRPYPYGFLKSLSLVSYILIGLMVQGIAFAWARARKGTREHGRRLVQYGAIAALVVFGAVSLFTFGITLEQYFKPSPMFFNADALRVRELDALLTGTGVGRTSPSVFLTDRVQVQGIPMGLAGYALRNEALYGNVSTGYGKLNNAAPNAVYDFALLARGEDPVVRGYQQTAIWENEKFALYPREPGVLVHQTLNLQSVNGRSIVLNIEARGVRAPDAASDPTPVTRGVEFALVTFAPETITLRGGETAVQLTLEPGVTRISVPRLDLPAKLVIESKVDSGLFVPYLQLRQASDGNGSATPLGAVVVQCAPDPEAFGAQCQVANPQGRELEWRWVVRGTLQGSREDREWTVAQAQASPRSRVQIRAAEDGALRGIQFDEDAPIETPRSALPDGKWRADVEIWDGAVLLARLPVWTRIEVADGARVRTERIETALPVILAP